MSINRIHKSSPGAVPNTPRENSLKVYQERVEKAPSIPISEKQFLLLHGDSFLSGTGLDGGLVTTMTEYWEELFSLWETSYLIDPQINPKEKKRILQGFKQIENTEKFFEKNDIEGLRSYIHKQLKEVGECCLVLKTIERFGLPGHVFLAIFESKDDYIYCHLLNKGEGAGLHPPLLSSETRDKKSYRYPPIKLNSKFFHPTNLNTSEPQKCGEELFKRLFGYRKTTPHKPYHSEEIYALFLIASEGIVNKPIPIAEATTQQRSGTCSGRLPELLIRHFLGGSNQRWSRVKLAARIQSFHDIRQESVYSKPLISSISEAVSGSAKHVQDLHEEKAISDEEFYICHTAMERCESFSSPSHFIKPIPNKLDGLETEFEPSSSSSSTLFLLQKELELEGKFKPIEKSPLQISAFPKNAKKVLSHLIEVRETLNSLEKGRNPKSKLQSFHLLIDNFFSMPIPTHDVDDYWNKIPQEEIFDCIKEIHFLTLHGLANLYPNNEYYKYYFNKFIFYTAYCIVHKLCTRLPELRLMGWKVASFIPYNEPIFFCPHGEEKEQMQKIKAYLIGQKGKNGTLFKIHHEQQAIEIAIDDIEDARRPQKKFEQYIVSQLRYLQTFVDEFSQKTNHQMKAEEVFGTVWSNKMPPSFYYLEDLAILGSKIMRRYSINFKDKDHEFQFPLKFFKTPDCPEKYFISYLNQNNSYSHEEFFYSGPLIIHPEAYDCAHLYDIQDRTENEWGIECKSHLSITPTWFYEEIAKTTIDKLKPLAIPNVLHILKGYRNYLAKETFQQLVMLHLLEGTNLEKACKHQPSLIDDLRDAFDSVIETFVQNPKTAKAAIFWISLAYRMESHLPKPVSKLETRAQKFRTWVRKLPLSPDREWLKIYLLRHKSDFSDDELIYILQAYLETTCPGRTAFLYLEIEGERIFSKLETLIQQKLDNNSDLRKTVFAPISERLKETGNWEGQYPAYTCRSIQVDLFNCLVYVNGKKEIRDIGPYLSKENQKRFREAVPNAGTITYADQKLTCHGGKVIGTFADKTLFRIYRKCQLGNSKEQWYQWIERKHTYYDSFLSSLPHSFITSHTIWRSEEGYAFFDSHGYPKAYSVKGVIEFLDQGDRLCKLPPLELATRLSKNWKEELYACANASGELTRLVWVPYKLNFTVCKNGVECDSLPGFYLDVNSPIPSLEGFEQALHLRNKKAESRILIPALSIENFHPFNPLSLKLNSKRPFFSDRTSYFVYSIEKTTGRLICNSTAGNLFLIALYALRSDFERAKNVLDNLNPLALYGSKEWEVLEALSRNTQNYKNPSLSAFMLHVALQIKDTEQLKKQPILQDKNEHKIFWENIKKHADHYLLVCQTFDSNRIPAFLRVKPSQLKIFNQKIDLKKSLVPKQLASIRNLPLPKYPNPYTSNNFNSRLSYKATSENKKISRHLLTGTYFVYEDLFLNLYEYYRTLPTDSLIADFDYFNHLVTHNETSPYMNLLYLVAKTDSSVFPELPENIKRNVPFNNFEKLKYNKACKDFLCKIIDLASNDLRVTGDWDFSFKCDYSESYNVKNKEPQAVSLLGQAFKPFTKYIKTKKTTSKISLDMAELEEWYPRPLESLQTFFQKTEHQSEQIPFVLQPTDKLPPLMSRVLANLNEGHLVNMQKKHSFYSMKENPKKALQKQIKKDSEARTKLSEEIERLANKNPLDCHGKLTVKELLKATKDELALWARQRKHLTLKNGLYEAFLAQDISFLQEQNPSLTTEDCQRIFEMTLNFMLLSSRIDQTKEALEKTEQWEKSSKDKQKLIEQEIGTILHKKRLYDPRIYPGLLAYEYVSGKFLRPEQTELLKKIMQNPSAERLIEFQAGGGKTKIISAILIHHFIKKGKLPVFFSLPALYDITKEDLKESINLFLHKKLRILEIGLHTPLNQDELDKIYQDLKKWKEEGCCLIADREMYHSFKLKHRIAVQEQQSGTAKSCLKILDFFKQNAVFIIDEGHLNAEALWKATIAKGKPSYLKEWERKLFVECYKGLTGNLDPQLLLEDGRFVHEVLQLTTNGQALIASEDKSSILESLAHHLVQYLKIEEDFDINEFKKYLTNPKVPMPSFVGDHPQMEHIFLIRGLLTQIFPHLLEMVQGFHHGSSIRKHDETEAPRIQRQPVRSQFESIEVAASLTCQGLFQRGLSLKQMKKALKLLINNHKENFFHTFHPEETQQAKDFIRWQKENGIEDPVSLNSVDVKEKKHIQLLHQQIGNHPELLAYYLANSLLGKVPFYPEKVSSTAFELVDGGNETILFSATLGLQEEYPLVSPPNHSMDFDHDFQAAVIQRACETQNRTLHWLNKKTPKKLFEDLYQKDPTLFNDLNGIIDVGGWNRDYSTKEVAEAFLNFIEKKAAFDGVIYIKENNGVNAGPSEIVLMRRDERKNLESISLHGSNLLHALKQVGYRDPENLRLFKIYGPSQCTGTDMYLEPDARMLITLGETVTLWPLVQAIMRMRRFLEPMQKDQAGQRLVWVGANKLKTLIPNVQSEKNLEAIFHWALEKECERMKNGIVACTFQTIEGMQRRKTSFEEDPSLFVQENKLEYSKYAGIQENVDTKELLQAAKDCRKKLDASENKYLEELITTTSELIPTIPQQKANISVAVAKQQKVEQSQQLQKNQALNKTLGSHHKKANTQLDYPLFERSLSSPILNVPTTQNSSKILYITPGHSLLGRKTNLFSEDLLLGINIFRTYKNDDFYKPISYFLVIQEGKTLKALACSQEDAAIYISQLQNGAEYPHRHAALFTAEGILCQNGKDNLKLNIEQIDKEWLKKILTDIQLINGRFTSPETAEFLKSQFAEWKEDPILREDFMELLARLKKIHEGSIDHPIFMLGSFLEIETQEENSDIESESESPKLELSSRKIGFLQGRKSRTLISVILFVSSGVIAALGIALASYFIFAYPLGPHIFYIISHPVSVSAVVSLGGGGALSLALLALASIHCYKSKSQKLA